MSLAQRGDLIGIEPRSPASHQTNGVSEIIQVCASSQKFAIPCRIMTLILLTASCSWASKFGLPGTEFYLRSRSSPLDRKQTIYMQLWDGKFSLVLNFDPRY